MPAPTLTPAKSLSRRTTFPHVCRWHHSLFLHPPSHGWPGCCVTRDWSPLRPLPWPSQRIEGSDNADPPAPSTSYIERSPRPLHRNNGLADGKLPSMVQRDSRFFGSRLTPRGVTCRRILRPVLLRAAHQPPLSLASNCDFMWFSSFRKWAKASPAVKGSSRGRSPILNQQMIKSNWNTTN